MLILLIFFAFLICAFLYFKNNRIIDANLNMYFFNAGKADSILIYNNDFSVLIDTGTNDLGDTIINYLEEKHINKLDYLIITHFDKDHVGSAHKIIKNIRIDNVLQSNYPKESNAYENYINALSSANIIPITVREDFSFEFGDIKFNVNPPTEEEYSKDPSNNSSLITSVIYKDISCIFMGDAQDARIKEFITYNSLSYNFMKVPYHGHYQNTLDSLIKNTNPQYAVITSSNDEPEDSETLELLSNNNITTYLTRNGSILLTSDGTKIEINQ